MDTDEINFWNNRIYSDQKTIISELNKRKNDIGLKKSVEAFWGEKFPDFLKHQTNQLAFFVRPTITPNMETRFFMDVVKDFGIEPLLLEFPDLFVTINKSKYHLGKTHHFRNLQSGEKIIEHKKHVDFNVWEGKLLTDVQTKEGINLQDLHHTWFYETFPNYTNKIIDISDWFYDIRTSYDYYYLGFLALGIFHGVIFENFILEDVRERQFFLEKVVPSFIEIERIFGIKPLISPILPLSNASLDRWYHYPA